MIRVRDRRAATYDVSFHVEMRLDHERNHLFSSALRAASVEGKVVADVGCGTGIWSEEALRLGARRVYGIDVDPEVLAIARGIVGRVAHSGDFTAVCADARSVVLPERVDVLVCEMLHAWLLEEHQLPAIVNLRGQSPAAVCVPQRVENYLTLGRFWLVADGLTVAEPFHVWRDDCLRVVELSESVCVESVDLRKDDGQERMLSLSLSVGSGESVNCVILSSRAELSPGVWLGETPTVMPRMVVPVEELVVGAGETVRIDVTYRPGARWNTIQCRLG
jgi:predicted RNA methylase